MRICGFLERCFIGRIGCDCLACECEVVALGGGGFKYCLYYYFTSTKCFVKARGIGKVEGTG